MNAVLAGWVLVASTCGTVAHAHDGGARPHSHHLGLLSLGEANGPSGGGRDFHRHIVLFGLEAGSMPADPDPDDDEPQPPAQVAVGFGTVKADAPDTPTPADLSLEAPCPRIFAESVAATKPPPADNPLRPLCAKAALSRSGVRLS